MALVTTTIEDTIKALKEEADRLEGLGEKKLAKSLRKEALNYEINLDTCWKGRVAFNPLNTSMR